MPTAPWALALFVPLLLLSDPSQAQEGRPRSLPQQETPKQTPQGSDVNPASAFKLMLSGNYQRTVVKCTHVSGNDMIYRGPFGPYNTLSEFVGTTEEMKVKNIAYIMDKKYGGLYHPELRPMTIEWAPVTVAGSKYEYTYIYYCDISTGHVGEYVVHVKGEVVSVDPPQVKETIKTACVRGIRIPGESDPFEPREGVVECLFNLKAN